MATRKRNRSNSFSRFPSPSHDSPSPSPSTPDEECFTKGTNNNHHHLSPDYIPGLFNDPSTSDLLLRLSLDPSLLASGSDDPAPTPPISPPILDLHVASSSLRRARYFDALLSDRWRQNESSEKSPRVITLIVGPSTTATCRRRRPFDGHVAVIRLLHTLDFASSVHSPTDALDLLPIASELLFDDLIRYCLRFLDAVPWTEEEEKLVLALVPMLQLHESKDLLSRIFPARSDSSKSPSEKMLGDLINSAIHAPPNSATVKTFVAKILRDYPSIDSKTMVLDSSFLQSLDAVKELMGKYASPDFRVAGNNDEREAMQRLHLHAAMTNIKHLYWIIERMVEMRVADNAVKEWSDQSGLSADLLKALKDDNFRNIAPGLPVFVTRCTLKLAGEVVSGHTLAPQQTRTKLVKVWLPVLNACRDLASLPGGSQRTVFHELEETFLQIISTLPIADAQELLHQCLSFSTRNVDDCPHLVNAFKTWFRRANRAPQGDP
ncbi:BTB/POZ domain-containing protein [Rhynchospora pubera]|uniref:BTB/POZ domain-containing protein n=1 Tax=Rhynchospora pubera TaxID=906938 RepID=A0AAV8D8F3_9POAL|nr:BTB/POZ domain-containing protein [Rhynchospora pubera]